MRRPQPPLLDLLLQRRHRLAHPLGAELAPHRLQRPDLVADELLHPVQLRLEVGLGAEVPAHVRSFRLIAAAGAKPTPPSMRGQARAWTPAILLRGCRKTTWT